MSIGHMCRRDVVTVEPGTTVSEVAKIMEDKNIGSVIVNGGSDKFGIVTDRDIALRVVNRCLDPVRTPIEEIMTQNPVLTLRDNMGLLEALDQIRKSAVRRFPVVDMDGNLKGIITLDDIIRLLGKEIADVASVIENEGPVF
ncbi:MAG: CBS domain-containing protein [Thermodesulfobacteriota bacterium]